MDEGCSDLEIAISPEAQAFIRKKGGQVVVFLGTASGCCTLGGVPMPMVDLGPPRLAGENYECRQIDGITVYLSQEAAAFDGRAEVTLSCSLWSPYLSIRTVHV